MKIKKQIIKEQAEPCDVFCQAIEQSEITKKNLEELTKRPSAIEGTLEREPKWMKKLAKGLVESYGPQLKENNYVFNVKNRKELADLSSQLKESKLEYKINRSLKEDYRYDVVINEAVEDELYKRFRFTVELPVYADIDIIAKDGQAATDFITDGIYPEEYSNETVGLEYEEDDDDIVYVDYLALHCDSIGNKIDLYGVNELEDEEQSYYQKYFGDYDDIDESLKEETDGYKISKDKQNCFTIESPSGRRYELFELVGLGNPKITSDIMAYFEVTDKGYKTLVGYNFGRDPEDAISYIKDYEEKGIRNLETDLLDESLKESESSKAKLIKLFKQFADTYDEIEYELQQLDPDYVAELFSGERLDSMNEVFQEVSFDELPIRAFSNEMVDFLEEHLEESCCKEEAKGIKHNPKEEKHFEEKCETCKECNEELAKTNKQLQESVKIIEDIWEYEPWSGAVETWEKIEKADKIEDLDFLLEDIYPDGLTKTELNDLLWFEADWVLEQLGLNEFEDETVEDEEADYDQDYERSYGPNSIPYLQKAVEKEYELEDGELDGMNIREAEAYLGLEDGELDRFIIEEKEEVEEEPVKESLKESKEKLEAGKNNKGWIFIKALEDDIKAIPELKDFNGKDYPTASKEVFEGEEAKEYFDGFDPKDSNWFVIEPTDKLYKEIEKVFKLKAKIKESLTKVKATEFNEDLSDEELNKFLGNPQKITEKLASEEPEEHFTEEEQIEYDIDEFGNSLNNYDEYVHCQWCGEPVSKFEAKHELNMGWLCPDCIAALDSRGEKGVFDESKKLTEAPDEFGLPTDDELAAEEEQAKKDLEAKLAAKRQQRDAARQKELDAKAAKEAAIKKGEELYNEFSKLYSESDSVDDAMEEAFSLLVPRSGAAETVAGEMVRAMMRILYRDYNDGDKFYEGYGLETCGGSAQYLCEQSEKLAKAFEDVVNEAQGYYDFDSKYTEAISNIADGLLGILSTQPELFGEVNTDDSRKNYEWEGETVSYDCEESLPDDLIKCLEKEWISESDIEQWVEDDIRMYYDTTDELSVEVKGGSWVHVDGLGSKSACEDLISGGQLYKWLESYAKDCMEENQSELYTASDFADWYDHSKEYDKLDKVNDIFSNYYGDDWYDMDDVESAYEEADEDIKQDISDIINESLKNKSAKSLTEGASKYQEFETLWNKLSKATDENNVDDSNKAVIEIEKILPFKDEEEHKHWLDVSSTFKFWEDFEDLTKSIAQRLKNIKEAKVDLTKVNGTYSQLLMDKIKDWNERFENEELGSIQEFKQEILNQIAAANDTPAKRNFIANLNRQNSVLNALMYVNNAVLKAMGAGVENSSLIKSETNLSLKESTSILLNNNDVAKGYIAVDNSGWSNQPRRIYTPNDKESDFIISDTLLPKENVVKYCAKHFEVDEDKVKVEFAYSLEDTDIYKVEISF